MPSSSELPMRVIFNCMLQSVLFLSHCSDIPTITMLFHSIYWFTDLILGIICKTLVPIINYVIATISFYLSCLELYSLSFYWETRKYNILCLKDISVLGVLTQNPDMSSALVPPTLRNCLIDPNTLFLLYITLSIVVKTCEFLLIWSHAHILCLFSTLAAVWLFINAWCRPSLYTEHALCIGPHICEVGPILRNMHKLHDWYSSPLCKLCNWPRVSPGLSLGRFFFIKIKL